MIAEFEARILALIDDMVEHASDDELFAGGYLRGHLTLAVAEAEEQGEHTAEALKARVEESLHKAIAAGELAAGSDLGARHVGKPLSGRHACRLTAMPGRITAPLIHELNRTPFQQLSYPHPIRIQRRQQACIARQRFAEQLRRQNFRRQRRRAQPARSQPADSEQAGIDRRLGDGFATLVLPLQILILRHRGLIVRQRADHRQMIAGGAAHAAARLMSADVHLLWPGLFRQAAQQALAVFLLLLLAVVGGGVATLVAGADAVLAVVGIDRRQVAVVAQDLFQLTEGRRA